jgi:glycosyltransferase involved in cell wall biosynthesis
MESRSIEIEILLPVYNETDIIEKVIREIYSTISEQLNCRFIICEDGSKDNSKEIIIKLCEEIPIKLISSDERKGYSQAVKDGMTASTAPYLLCLDSDGQCDPRDFWKFWEFRDRYDVIVGWRVKRRDVFWRLLFSRMFYYIYQMFFKVPIHDPSCPFVLVKKNVIDDLVNKMGDMQQAYWWEFTVRVFSANYKIMEVKINHRYRLAGKTQIFGLNKVLGIGYRNFLALFRILRQINKEHI